MAKGPPSSAAAQSTRPRRVAMVGNTRRTLPVTASNPSIHIADTASCSPATTRGASHAAPPPLKAARASATPRMTASRPHSMPEATPNA